VDGITGVLVEGAASSDAAPATEDPPSSEAGPSEVESGVPPSEKVEGGVESGLGREALGDTRTAQLATLAEQADLR